MKAFVCMALAGLTAASSQLDYEFMQYIVKYNKSYPTFEEYESRLATYAEKELVIQAHNSSQDSYRLAHNKFSDWTEEEMSTLLGARKVQGYLSKPTILPVKGTYEPINWIEAGAVNPIQDQGQCGSCWAFSTVAGLEGAVAIDKGHLYKFSEQQLVSCSHEGENSGCGGGMAYDAYDYYRQKGPMSEASYPYTAKDGFCQYESGNAYPYHTQDPSSHVTVAFDDVDQMYSALSLKPLNVSICASSNAFHLYQSGIFNDPTCGNQHNHATNVVGFGTENNVDYWLMRNSWGTDWGEQGYMKLEVQATGDGICGIQMWPIYPLLQ